MTSPMLTVAILAVLWLIVVVPMVLRRNDERAQERAIARFGKAMRAMGRRQMTLARVDRHAADDEATVLVPHVVGPRAEVFASRTPLPTATRRPVPAAQEALMYPVDRSEMSEARRQMLARRRRTLTTLIGGLVASFLLSRLVGGVFGMLTIVFLLGLGGYLYFLRSQALRDRARRSARRDRAQSRRMRGEPAYGEYDYADGMPESAVRIDDDDLNLQSFDTIDLTGLYQDAVADVSLQRRAS